MSIGENKIINKLMSLEVYGKDYGKINHFGGNIVRGDSEYLKKVFNSANEYLNNIVYDPTNSDAITQPIITGIGLKAGFFFVGDVLTSETWKDNVLPIVNRQEDWVSGCISVLNTMGMGKWKIRDFTANEKLVLNVYNSFETEYYREKRVNNHNNATEFGLSTGISTSIMALIYDTNITSEKVDVNMELYNKCFGKEDCFWSREVRFTETKNEDYCEIIVERKEVEINEDEDDD